jgi:hypothetical protein
MPGRGLYDTVKQAIQDVVAPQLQELKGDIAGLRGDIVGLVGEARQIKSAWKMALPRSEVRCTCASPPSTRSSPNVSIIPTSSSKKLFGVRERLAALEARVAYQS